MRRPAPPARRPRAHRARRGRRAASSRSSWVATTTTRPLSAISRSRRRTPVDLHVVEVGGRLVGEEQGRIVAERPGDRHPLLLPTGQVTRPVCPPVRRGRPARAARRRGRRAARPRMPGARSGIWTFSRRGEARDEVERLEHDADLCGGTSAELASVRARDLDVVERIAPGGGVQDRRPARRAAWSCRSRSHRASSTSSPDAHLEVEPVDRTDHVATARVLDGEVPADERSP